MTTRNLTGLDRSAVLMMTLSQESAAAVFRHLSTRDSKALATKMSELGPLTSDMVYQALSAFHDDIRQHHAIDIDIKQHLKGILGQALGQERGDSLFDELFEQTDAEGFDALNLMEPSAVADVIRSEHPQAIATIIIQLERQQGANILLALEPEQRDDVMLRIATYSHVQPGALSELTGVIQERLGGQQIRHARMGGANTAAGLLNNFGSQDETSALTTIRAENEELADQIMEQMFVFDDIVRLDDITIQRILRELDNNTLAVALRGTDTGLYQHFVSNMSNRAAELLVEEIEMQGPIRSSQVDTERKNILATMRRLADDGEIQLNTSDDEYV